MDYSYAYAMDPALSAWSWVGTIVSYVYHSLTVMFIFRKAGLKGWQAWVPIFSTWRLLQLGGQKGWWVLFVFIPIVGWVLYLVYLIMAGLQIQAALGKPGVFYLLAILVTPVWYGILAWDSSTWNPKHTPLVPPSGYESPSAGPAAAATA